MPGPNRRGNNIVKTLEEVANMIDDARRMRSEAVSNLQMAKTLLEEELQKVTKELEQIEE